MISQVFSQTTKIKLLNIPEGGLQIGDKIPEEVWNLPLQVVYHPEGKETITLNDYRGKLIILDFWATWCGSCIVAMPKMHALQEKFRDSIAILSSTYEEKDIAETFLNTNQNIKDLHLFSIVNNNTFKSIFYHRLLPHFVWISPKGNILTTSDASQINPDNILGLLTKSKMTIKSKVDLPRTDYPFIKEELLSGIGILNYSLLIRGLYSGLNSGTERKIGESGENIMIKASNLPIMPIYQYAISKIFSAATHEDYGWKNRNIIEISNPANTKIAYSENEKELPDSCFFSLFLSVPISHSSTIYEEMLKCLNQYSPYSGTIEKKLTKCLILTRTSTKDKIRTKGGKQVGTLFFNKDGNGELNNFPISQLANFIQSLGIINLPVTDGTWYPNNIDIKMNLQEGNMTLPELKEQLHVYDLDLVEGKKELYMFVLRDK